MHRNGMEILLIGHAGHPEVIGTLGQLPDGAVTLIETREDAEAYVARDPARLAFVTQTTLSVDDTAEIVATLRHKYPEIQFPRKEDICYATTNRQAAVKVVAGRSDLVLVIGAPASSNSNRLVEVAERAGCPKAVLIEDVFQIPWTDVAKAKTIGISAGASAPEVLVHRVIDAIRESYDAAVETVTTTEESVVFNIPRELRPEPDPKLTTVQQE